MQIRSKVTPEEAKEAAGLLRPHNFWLKFFVANWYATVIGILLIGVNVNLLVEGKQIKAGPSAGLLLFVAAALFYSWYRYVGKVTKALQASSARIEDLSLGSDGVKVVVDTGASSFVPWSSYEKWSEAKNIFLLKGKDGATILPVDDRNRLTVRNLLQSKIN
ncbi:MAG TPA: YcxB family protein [Methylocella sp.]|nr:YcxB family protein [Methylocella sp.]